MDVQPKTPDRQAGLASRIQCPKCGEAIELTALLRDQIEAGVRPQIEAAYAARTAEAVERAKREARQLQEHDNKETEEKLRAKDQELATARKRLGDAAQKEAALLQRERTVEDRERDAALLVERKLAEETGRIRKQAQDEARERAEREAAKTIRAKEEDLVAAQRRLEEASKKEAELIRAQREMEDRLRQAPVELERRLNEEAAKMREQIAQEAAQAKELREEEHRLKEASMQRTIDELQRKAQQGSEQIQGEAAEVVLQELLARAFPRDQFQEVAKGVAGADLRQRVRDNAGSDCGTILWESKRTKSWEEKWLPKLRDEIRAAGAAVGVIVTRTMPPEMRSFGLRDGIWICGWDQIVPFATILRMRMVDVTNALRTAEGRTEKADRAYDYLASPEFKNRVGGVIEAYAQMRKDLEKEKRAVQSLWSKREEQIERAIENLAAFYGRLRGIGEGAIAEIPGLEFAATEHIGPPAAAETTALPNDPTPTP